MVILGSILLTISQKYGRPNEKTPAKWNESYKDLGAPAPESVAPAATPAKIEAPKADSGSDEEIEDKSSSPVAEEKSKKRKHDGETAEEKAERKKKKKEKKEKKAKKDE